mmetsp:Transcript_9226/g.22665  ORF Transcript_9226/g.22665 Transcript_9226/m.22665 type:complete len:326 (-) Transcript_9226:122-1099(-)|eukprot:CAMPEP_0114503482 /NCGR_PEP_ID=MMETSP0109-20121206/9672_1 /TAXON_ID=29199 /ORGANISM="Chlorarachnion reptans, Strain CCCM449" /LENGTH=325 /DNA_ID=CAMNT_0001681515 /DNA_START=108 /DNA_END=1085 /DNA_ORIENTATION=+
MAEAKVPTPPPGPALGRFLSTEQVQNYFADGYLVVPSFWDEKEVSGVLDTVRDLEQKVRRVPSPFKSQVANSAKDLIESAHQVVGFSAGSNSPVQQIGHNLHELVPSIRALCYSDTIWKLCVDLGIKNPMIVQSKFVMKPKQHGWRVPVHTDEQFIFTNPISGFGLWWALEDCTKENGCLEVICKSHKDYFMTQRFECDHQNAKTQFVRFDRGDQNDREQKTAWTRKVEKEQRDKWTALQMRPGDLVILHPQVLHTSRANRSTKSRRALTLHIIDGSSSWNPKNWIQPTKNYFCEFPQYMKILKSRAPADSLQENREANREGETD